MKKYTFATLEKGHTGLCWEVPAVVYDWIYNKGYRDGKEEGELVARRDLCEARLELAAHRLARLRGEEPAPAPEIDADELAAYLQAMREKQEALPS